MVVVEVVRLLTRIISIGLIFLIDDNPGVPKGEEGRDPGGGATRTPGGRAAREEE